MPDTPEQNQVPGMEQNPILPNPNKIAGYQNLVTIFDGEIFTNVEYFVKNLEDIGKIARWNDSELIAVLKSKLKGPALQFFMNDPELINEELFSNIKEKFIKFFENRTTLSHRQQQFSNCRQNPGESVRNFSSRVSNLTVNYFGLQNSSKEDAGPIVNQTKLAKFLEGLQTPLKRLALNRNPSTFEEAVENALLDEINMQFTDGTGNCNNCAIEPQSAIQNKLTEILDKQAEISNHMISTLTNHIQKMSIQEQSPPPRYPSPRNHQRNYLRHQSCIHCGRDNHPSRSCWFQPNQTYSNNYRYNRSRVRGANRGARNIANRSYENSHQPFELERENFSPSYQARSFTRGADRGNARNTVSGDSNLLNYPRNR
ncbi:uncharacterized protein LOC129222989 [Uloborus diversus]|uniref:uncharacterized protein LOC129222989 n=1 Tax=Uloborus diversus TaxID=327109 RepID=UPI002409670B|nr:uncharacterized protein LOC129222989 [Uloborus diversus]